MRYAYFGDLVRFLVLVGPSHLRANGYHSIAGSEHKVLDSDGVWPYIVRPREAALRAGAS